MYSNNTQITNLKKAIDTLEAQRAALRDVYGERCASYDVRHSRNHYCLALDMFNEMGATGYIDVARARLSAAESDKEIIHGR